jgi:hypothetical protein
MSQNLQTHVAPAPATSDVPCTHLDTVAKFFRALSDPTRLGLLEFILSGERTSAECVQHSGDGRKLRYSVGDPRVVDLLVLARSLAADNATALTCCTRIPNHQD